MVVAGKLVLAKTQRGVTFLDPLGHGRVGGQKMIELKRVLLVRFPDLLPFRFVGRMPVVATAD